MSAKAACARPARSAHQESGNAGLSISDWLVESARVEAELRGEPAPRREELLARFTAR